MFNLPDKWSPLKSVVLGRSYPEEFYDSVKNKKIQSCLQQIANETEEDYQYFEQQLKSHGVEVFRPSLDSSDRINNYIDQEGKIQTNFKYVDGQLVNKATNKQNIFVSSTLIPKPPMTPRDSWVIVDDHILQTAIDHPSTELLIQQLDKDNKTINCWQQFGANLPGGNIFQIGKDIYLDKFELDPQAMEKIINRFPQYRWHKLDIEGHADGTYHPIKPGAIISLRQIQTYSETFPGWDVLYLPGQSWGKVSGFLQIKGKNNGRWWLPEHEDNDEFTHFVDTWLTNWVGYVEETVFDVNCLVLDEKHIFVNNYNKDVFDFLKRHNMEPIIIPFRHRYFWDGGLHCITLELNRKGPINDYFPARGND
jgi:hypothetical protein